MMKYFGTLIAAFALFTGVIAQSANADDKAVVQTFYDFLSNPASQDHAESLRASLADDWKSIGDYSGRSKSSDQFVGQIGGFSKLIPDLNWAVEEMIVAGNRVIVRGRATGTPQGPLFGVDGKGKGFEIMSVDIHTVENDKIVMTYHVEDWAGALRQLKAN
jgi:predicted ester cyclase